jgi:hypothetical protein
MKQKPLGTNPCSDIIMGSGGPGQQARRQELCWGDKFPTFDGTRPYNPCNEITLSEPKKISAGQVKALRESTGREYTTFHENPLAIGPKPKPIDFYIKNTLDSMKIEHVETTLDHFSRRTTLVMTLAGQFNSIEEMNEVRQKIADLLKPYQPTDKPIGNHTFTVLDN